MSMWISQVQILSPRPARALVSREADGSTQGEEARCLTWAVDLLGRHDLVLVHRRRAAPRRAIDQPILDGLQTVMALPAAVIPSASSALRARSFSLGIGSGPAGGASRDALAA